MVESAPTSPVKTPTKTKKSTAKKPVQDTSATKVPRAPSHPKCDDMVLLAVNALTEGHAKGVTKTSICNFITSTYGLEIKKPLNNKIKMSIIKYKDEGILTVFKGENLTSWHFKMEANFRKKLRTNPTNRPSELLSPKKKPEAKKQAAKTPEKKTAKKSTPKKPAAKKPAVKKSAPKTTPKKK